MGQVVNDIADRIGQFCKDTPGIKSVVRRNGDPFDTYFFILHKDQYDNYSDIKIAVGNFEKLLYAEHKLFARFHALPFTIEETKKICDFDDILYP